MPAASIIGAGLQIVGGLFGSSAAKKRARRLARQLKAETKKLKSLENNRQQIVNPYSNVKDVSNLAVSQAQKISNPFANLSVATKASEIQMEQSDLALANTLDTLRATGAGAGGATALAQAALQSKQGVAANIEQQEAQNEKLRAQGEMQLQDKRIAEQQRLQGVQMSEALRMQDADAQGKTFGFNVQEQRDVMKLNRLSGLSQQYQAQQAASLGARSSAIAGGISGLTSIATSPMQVVNGFQQHNKYGSIR